MEIWDVYDRYRNLTGKKILKTQRASLKAGEYETVVHVGIFNSDNELLIQKRQSFKETYPNLWDITAGGHVVSGETSEEAIERELFEELGYKYDFSLERPYFTINYKNGFDDIYVIKDDIEINNLKLQYEEVQNIVWATKEEVLQLIDENKFIPYNKGFIELLFHQNYNRGVLEWRKKTKI